MTTAIDTYCAVLRSGRLLVDRSAARKRLLNLLAEEEHNPLLISVLGDGFEWMDFALHLRDLLGAQNHRLLVNSKHLCELLAKRFRKDEDESPEWAQK